MYLCIYINVTGSISIQSCTVEDTGETNKNKTKKKKQIKNT